MHSHDKWTKCENSTIHLIVGMMEWGSWALKNIRIIVFILLSIWLRVNGWQSIHNFECCWLETFSAIRSKCCPRHTISHSFNAHLPDKLLINLPCDIRIRALIFRFVWQSGSLFFSLMGFFFIRFRFQAIWPNSVKTQSVSNINHRISTHISNGNVMCTEFQLSDLIFWSAVDSYVELAFSSEYNLL